MELYDIIHNMTDTLKNTGQKTVVLIVTDGTPTDKRGYSDSFVREAFIKALRWLLELPVWVVFWL